MTDLNIVVTKICTAFPKCIYLAKLPMHIHDPTWGESKKKWLLASVSIKLNLGHIDPQHHRRVMKCLFVAARCWSEFAWCGGCQVWSSCDFVRQCWAPPLPEELQALLWRQPPPERTCDRTQLGTGITRAPLAATCGCYLGIRCILWTWRWVFFSLVLSYTSF